MPSEKTPPDVTQLPPHEFLFVCEGWKADMIATSEWEEIQEDINSDVLKCPVHLYAKIRGICKRTTGGTQRCPVCGHYMCPDCMNHATDIMSRVTGYLQIVSSWNTAKKQEFEDRKRYTLQ